MKIQLLAVLTTIARGCGVVASAVGMIFGAEPVTLKTVLGMLMTVGGIILLTIG